MFPKWFIDKSVKGYLSKVTTTGKDASKCEISNCHFYKLPYIGYYSSYTGRKISSIVNKYCKDLNVLFISLHVRAVELVILVKPIGISTHVLMSILVLLKVVGISVISLVLRFSIMPALILSAQNKREFSY